MIQRGLSERSVTRFCERYNIHVTSRVPDPALDTVVKSSVAKVTDNATNAYHSPTSIYIY